MRTKATIPDDLRRRPFTTTEARQRGLTERVLTGRRFRRLFHGVWICADAELTLLVRIKAAQLVLPADAVASHTTALALLGVESIGTSTLHFSTNTALRSRQDGIVLHRRQGLLHPDILDGIALTGPDRGFVDSATILSHRDLVRAGDALVRLGRTDVDRLSAYAHDRHLDGVRRARRAVLLVRAGVDSVRETDLRLLLRFARLPEPSVNVWIVNPAGAAIARGDLVFRTYHVIVEYDGWHHERDVRQRQKDHLRRERLEAAGWTVIVVTAEDFKDPMGIVRRVHHALVSNGYVGPRPVMSTTWHSWFGAAA